MSTRGYSDFTNPNNVTRTRHADERELRIARRKEIDGAVVKAGGRSGMSLPDRRQFASRLGSPTPLMPGAPQGASTSGPAAPMPAPHADPTSPTTPGVPTHLPGPTIAKGDTNPVHVASAIAANKAAVASGGMGTVSDTQNAQRPAPMVPRTFAAPAAPSNAPQLHDPAAENAAAGFVKEVTPTKTTLASQYGTGSSTNPQQRNQALFQKHPNIFKAGTPENAAFVAHAKQYGLDEAHKNVDALMAPFAPLRGTEPKTAQEASSVLQSTAQRISTNKEASKSIPKEPLPIRPQQPTPEETGAAADKEFVGAVKDFYGRAVPEAVKGVGSRIASGFKSARNAVMGDPTAPAPSSTPAAPAPSPVAAPKYPDATAETEADRRRRLGGLGVQKPVATGF